MKKTPRFFCDNCGYEVGNNVKSCPYCGRFFASVRCPVCDFSGPDKAFLNGCPLCGYSAPPVPKQGKMPQKPKKRQRAPAGSLPTWALITAVIALLVIIFLFSYLITM